MTLLRARLDALVHRTDEPARLATDPLRFPRRYRDPGDVEVAAFLSASLAFGRVGLFGAVLERIFAVADAAGGPAAWVDDGDFRGLQGVYYRWHGTGDIVALCALAGRVRALGGFETLFQGQPFARALPEVIVALRAQSPENRSFRTFLPSPLDGSACKRWCLFARWMVRDATPDLGLWTSLRARDLVIPLDTHVFRLSRLVGLTRRATPGWATAVEVTAALAALCPEDPLRYDFALAHLGISGECRNRRDAEVCPPCALRAICVHGTDIGDRPGAGGLCCRS